MKELRLRLATMTLIALGFGLGLPSAASAATYEIDAGSTMTVNGPLAHIRGGLTLELSGGHFDYDDVTGELGDVTVLTSGGNTYTISGDDFRDFGMTPDYAWGIAGSEQIQAAVAVDLHLASSISPTDEPPIVGAVPEPSAALLFGAGILAVGRASRRRDR